MGNSVDGHGAHATDSFAAVVVLEVGYIDIFDAEEGDVADESEAWLSCSVGEDDEEAEDGEKEQDKEGENEDETELDLPFSGDCHKGELTPPTSDSDLLWLIL